MKKVLFTLFAALFIVAASCKKDDPKPAPGKDDPKTPPTEQTVNVTGVTLDQTTLSLTIGNTQLLKATIAPANATNKSVTWNSSNPAVVSVSDGGNLEAKSVGEATITVTTVDGGKTATCAITVNPVVPVESIDIPIYSEKSFLALSLHPTAGMDIEATVLPENATNTKVTWTVDDPSIVEISKIVSNTCCTIRGTKEGYTYLRATSEDGGKTAAILISVGSSDVVNGFCSDLRIPVRIIPSGTFQMGSPDSDTEANPEEKPQHSVTLTEEFMMSKFEITNAQFADFLNSNNIGSDGNYNSNTVVVANELGVQYNESEAKWQAALGKDHYPIVNVTCFGANEFANWVGGRLPTEAEWEYVCRAGSTTPYFFGETAENLGNYAWYAQNSQVETTNPVGQKLANPWGLYDILGNVWEWCADWYEDYSASAQTDPTGPSSGELRIIRGMSIEDTSLAGRSAYRYSMLPDAYGSGLGFRVVWEY